MAESGIKITYLSGGSDSITSITCLSSFPRLKGTIRLNAFTNLTTFDGGDNGLEAVTGFSQLTALTTFRMQGQNTVGFNLLELPRSLEYFDVFGQNTITGNISALPSTLRRYRNRGNNTTTGNLSTLPSSMGTYDNQGANTVYEYYNGASLGFNQKVWTSTKQTWNLKPALSSGVPGMSPYHLATLVIDLSGLTWNNTLLIGETIFSTFTAAGPENPYLNLLDYSYGPQLSAAIDEMSNNGCSVTLNLTAFLDPDAEAYKTLIS